VLTLDDLSALSFDALGELYANGTVPADLTALDNHPRGRMVSLRGIAKTPLHGGVVWLSKQSWFPWNGKSLSSTGAQTHDGINRMVLGARMNWFPFTTRVETSVIDGKDTIYLDYEQPGNPIFIRKIRDELREVAPGMYLGPAMWKTGPGKAALVLWFALDTNA
jgi:hypothetical protein